MDKAKLIALKDESSKLFDETLKQRNILKEQHDAADVELTKIQGDFRTLEKLISEWVDTTSTPEPIVGEVITPEVPSA